MNEFFANPITQYVLLAALLFVAVQGVRLLEAKRKEADANTEEHNDYAWLLDRAAEGIVYAVEQMSTSKPLQIEKKDRRDAAIKFLEKWLNDNDYPPVPVEQLIVLVEKTVYLLFHK